MPAIAPRPIARFTKAAHARHATAPRLNMASPSWGSAFPIGFSRLELGLILRMGGLKISKWNFDFCSQETMNHGRGQSTYSRLKLVPPPSKLASTGLFCASAAKK